MGTWDTGHFDNDTAADFGGQLDDTPADRRADLLRDTLRRAADETGYLDSDDAAQAVAAAALTAAQCPGGTPVTTAYGPQQALPTLPGDLRPLAVRALDRIVTEPSELLELWGESSDAEPWRTGIRALRDVLDTAGTPAASP